MPAWGVYKVGVLKEFPLSWLLYALNYKDHLNIQDMYDLAEGLKHAYCIQSSIILNLCNS